VSQLVDNLSALQRKINAYAIASGREVSDIQLIAVSKTRTLDEVVQIADAGQIHFGENTVQDALTKIPHLAQQLEWHFIGHLQSKKAGKLPGYFQWIHSIDSLKLAQKLSSAMSRHSDHSVLNCLIQVNVSGDEHKSGIKPEGVKSFLSALLNLRLPCLQWRGLMTIGVQGNEQETRQAFSQLRQLQQQCKTELNLPSFDQLSMGMSGDYGIAIEEGATLIRVGTSIFGKRS